VARLPAMNVLPTPPFPEIAIFTGYFLQVLRRLFSVFSY